MMKYYESETTILPRFKPLVEPRLTAIDQLLTQQMVLNLKDTLPRFDILIVRKVTGFEEKYPLRGTVQIG